MKRFLKNNMSLLLSLLAVFSIVGSTYAYLAATDSELLNSFKLAKIDTSITEDLTGGIGAKKVTIVNNDVSSVFVRARVLVSAGDVGVKTIEFADRDESQPMGSVIKVVYNGEYWADGGDGWYYYKQVLPGTSDADPNPQTQPLITKVLVGDEVIPAGENDRQFEVDVYEESVLTSATNPVELSTVTAAFAAKAQA